MIGEAQTSLEEIGVRQIYCVPAEYEGSFKTPLKHAGIYGLFLVNELAGQHLDPLTEWTLNWISELAKGNAEAPSGETLRASTDSLAEIQRWLSGHIKTAQEPGESSDSFAFVLSADVSGGDATRDLPGISDYAPHVGPLDTTTHAEQQVADVLQDTMLANQTISSSWITADDFIA